MELHIFSNLGGTIESSLIEPAQKIAMALAGNLIPFVVGGLTIWIMIYGLATVRGAVHTPINDFVWRALKISLIVFVGTAGGIYQSETYGFYSELSNTIFNAISQGAGGICAFAVNDPMGIYRALDCMSAEMFTPLLKTLTAISNLMKPPNAGALEVGVNFLTYLPELLLCIFMLGIAFLCSILLVVYMGFEVIALRVTLSLALALSPLFIFALAFDPIKSLFTNWLNVVIKSIIFQALFLTFMGIAFGAVSNLTTGMFKDAEAIHSQANAMGSNGNTGDALAATAIDIGARLLAMDIDLLSFIIMMLVFVFVASRIPHLASELSGGGAGGAGLGTLLTAKVAGMTGKKLADTWKNRNNGGGELKQNG